MVKAAYSCGKPALGVGAGNVPAYIERTAKLRAGRQRRRAVQVVRQRHGLRLRAGRHPRRPNLRGGHGRVRQAARLPLPTPRRRPLWSSSSSVSSADGTALRRAPSSTPQSSAEPGMDRRAGRASRCPRTPRSSWSRSASVGPARAADPGEALPGAGRAAGGRARARHHPGRADGRVGRPGPQRRHPHRGRAARRSSSAAGSRPSGSSATRPPRMGGIGDIYNAFLPSLTLGCGSYGHNSVSGNVSAVNLINIKRVGRRNNNLQWFKVPAQDLLRAERHPLPDRHARRAPGDHRDRRDDDPARLRRQDHRRPAPTRRDRSPCRSSTTVEPEPSVDTVTSGRRADARLPAGHHHRARRRLADGRRQGDVAAVRAPGRRSSPT